MRYVTLLVLVIGLVACDPSDAIDVDVNPPQVVEDAVNGVQQGAEQLNNTIQSFGEEGGGEPENGAEGENGEN